VDRDPVESWTSGRITVIGDAAHPMQPIGSQAGSQAVVDARVLTSALLSNPDPAQALQRYGAKAILRTVMSSIMRRRSGLMGFSLIAVLLL
jgi:2-polyprenyl-6-methoxyphenol hydroxylase-like FAD-dependent oxidoreductase